jgi:small subunit ribosomal protein S6
MSSQAAISPPFLVIVDITKSICATVSSSVSVGLRRKYMSKLKHYETMFIIKPTLTEEETVAQIDLVISTITKNGGEIAACDDIGSKNLAYEIEKNKRGYYFVAYFKGEPSGILEVERNYRINENILRFIFIKYENKKEISSWTKMSEAAAKKAN